MAYLNFPRLVFTGRFQADVSTVNNDPQHFDNAAFRSNYQLLHQKDHPNGWWNPRGTGAWRFFECAVTTVWYKDGTSCKDASIDPVVGMPINGSNNRVEGKLVDLDAEQQMVSEIWGFQLLLGDPKQGMGFASDYEVAPFANIWMRYPQGKPDSCFSAFYQSVLSNIQWNLEGNSRFLRELEGSKLPEQLSIRFTVDGYQDDITQPWFTFGRIVGSIGLAHKDEPKSFVLGRHLDPAVPSPSVNRAVSTIVGNQLVVDLGNSLPTVAAGDKLQDLGNLYMAILPQKGKPIILGEINYQTPDWYQSTAGIQAFQLSDKLAQQAKESPLGLIQTAPNKSIILLQEREIFVHAEPYVLRLNADDEAQVTFYATQLGQPLENSSLTLAFDNSFVQAQGNQGPIPGPLAGVPESALQFDRIVPIKNGRGTVSLQARPPGNPRGYIDGQVYGVSYAVGKKPAKPASFSVPNDILNVRVWDAYNVPDEPTWMRDVGPIFQQYANLYPIMKPIVDLSNYAHVVQRLNILKYVFDVPVTDPNYMPVTRDLSTPKREMIRKFLKNPVYMRCESIHDVKTALQQAIELEHATLPPYLCALYSIKPGRNREVANLLRSIVLEEMLHMSLACNILVAIGGSPAIGVPGFTPRYPGPLPGGLRADLTVRLRRCSIEQIRDVFLPIEEPSETVEMVDGLVKPDAPVDHHAYTIGWFYDHIAASLTTLHDKGELAFGHLDRQAAATIGPHDLYKIKDLETALSAIEEIKDQGEGTSPLDPVEDDSELDLSHYYKFSEVVHGRRLVVKEGGFSYTGEQIPFDPDGVYPMMDDPDTVHLKSGSQAQILSKQFNQTYQNLLNALHQTFNGDPDHMGEAIGLMYSLNLAARRLMETPSGREDGTTAGPSFQAPTS